MKLNARQFLALLPLCVVQEHAQGAAHTLQATRQGPEWAVSVREVGGELLRCALSPAHHTAGATLSVQPLTAEGADAGPRRELLLPEVIDASWIRGSMDVAAAPGGGLIVTAAFPDGGSNSLHVWRVDASPATEGRKLVVQRSSQVFSTVRIPAVGSDPSAAPLEFGQFEQPRLLVRGAHVDLLVSAVQIQDLVVVSERQILQLELSQGLGSIRSARVVGTGSDPRVHGAQGAWWLTSRGLDATEPESPRPALLVYRSADGLSWEPRSVPALPLQLASDYAMSIASGELWIAAPEEHDRRSVRLLRLDRLAAVWSEQGSLSLASAAHSHRAESVWFPESGDEAAGRPQIAFPDVNGLRVVRW